MFRLSRTTRFLSIPRLSPSLSMPRRLILSLATLLSSTRTTVLLVSFSRRFVLRLTRLSRLLLMC
nr:MAG TPA: hypothetical protein [Caudoviricetes sp.]